MGAAKPVISALLCGESLGRSWKELRKVVAGDGDAGVFADGSA